MKNEETKETQENNAPTNDELADIKAQLEAERGALAEAQAALAERNDTVTQLEAELEAVKAENTKALATFAELHDAHTQAVGKYLEVVRAANTAIPADLISGETIEDIESSLEKAQTLTDAIRASLAAEARNTKVPAGAPTRSVNLDALSPEEKIRLGLSQQGGTSK